MVIADEKAFICLKTERLFWRGVPKCWVTWPPVCQPKHEPTDFEITYKSGCLGERNAKANDYC